jgi:hypothetical protein
MFRKKIRQESIRYQVFDKIVSIDREVDSAADSLEFIQRQDLAESL